MTNDELLDTAAELLSAVRNYLDITWTDEAGDQKISGFIARGIRYLNDTAGADLDYDAEDSPRALLFDYCRYARSNALEDFQVNYGHELLSLHIRVEVSAYGAAEESADVQ